MTGAWRAVYRPRSRPARGTGEAGAGEAGAGEAGATPTAGSWTWALATSVSKTEQFSQPITHLRAFVRNTVTGEELSTAWHQVAPIDLDEGDANTVIPLLEDLGTLELLAAGGGAIVVTTPAQAAAAERVCFAAETEIVRTWQPGDPYPEPPDDHIPPRPANYPDGSGGSGGWPSTASGGYCDDGEVNRAGPGRPRRAGRDPPHDQRAAAVSGGLEGRVRAAVAEVRGLAGVGARAGVSAGDLVLLEERLGCYLPAAYRALLGESNGIELGYGFDRWLGYGPGAPVDVVWWNDPGTWKWAYAEWDTDGLLEEFLVLAVHVDGLPTGCLRRDLRAPGADPPYFVMTALAHLMPAQAPLSGAVVKGLPAAASRWRDDLLGGAVWDRFGAVPADRLVVHSPLKWPHFSDDEADLEGAVLLPADEAMVVQADVWREVSRLGEGDEVTGVELWRDGEGRQRLRFQIRRAR